MVRLSLATFLTDMTKAAWGMESFFWFTVWGSVCHGREGMDRSGKRRVTFLPQQGNRDGWIMEPTASCPCLVWVFPPQLTQPRRSLADRKQEFYLLGDCSRGQVHNQCHPSHLIICVLSGYYWVQLSKHHPQQQNNEVDHSPQRAQAATYPL